MTIKVKSGDGQKTQAEKSKEISGKTGGQKPCMRLTEAGKRIDRQKIVMVD